MPSVTSSKANADVVAPVPTDTAEFTKSMVVIMEKKIRNLDRRKVKLDERKAKQKEGHTLKAEQLEALAKYDEVVAQIEVYQELVNQFNSYSAEAERLMKREEKRRKFEQLIKDKQYITELLQIQSVMEQLGDESTRQLFADGAEGTVKLEQAELDVLDEFYKLIHPEMSEDDSIEAQNREAANHIYKLLEAKDHEVCGKTYRQLGELISKIKSAAFFTEKPTPQPADEADQETSTEKDFVVVQSEEVPHADSEEVQSSLPPEVSPAAEEETAGEHDIDRAQQVADPYSQQQEQQLPAAADMYQQPSVQHQALYAENVHHSSAPAKSFEQIVEHVQGRFNFLQESEIDLDSPSHVDPAVVSVHQMPASHFPSQPLPQQPVTNVFAQTTDNHHMYAPLSSAYQQQQQPPYMPSTNTAHHHHHQTNLPPYTQPIPMPEEKASSDLAAASSTLENSSSTNENQFVDSASFQQQQTTPPPDEQQQSAKDESSFPGHHSQNRGQSMRQGGGGYRGGRGGRSNGFGSSRGGRGGGGPYRGGSGYNDRSGVNDRSNGSGDRPVNGHYDGGRPSRGGPRGASRGGGSGYRGGPGGHRGGGSAPRGGSSYNRGGFRGNQSAASSGPQQ